MESGDLSEMNFKKDDDLIVTQNIEFALMKLDSLLWSEVKQQLKTRHDSEFEICLDHPEYLKEILMEICGDSYPEVVRKFTKKFDGKFTNERIEHLVKTLLE